MTSSTQTAQGGEEKSPSADKEYAAPEISERKRRRHIHMLRRRAEHLDQRIAGYRGRDPSYDIAERNALRWALAQITGGPNGRADTDDRQDG